MNQVAAMTPQVVAGMFGCTVDQVRAQYAANAKQLEAMAQRARENGGRLRGYTAQQLTERAEAFRASANQ